MTFTQVTPLLYIFVTIAFPVLNARSLMSLLEKSLWTLLTLAAGFVCISLLSHDLQPHRFLFGVPFSLAILTVMAAASILSGGALLQHITGMVPEAIARRAWLSLLGVMCVRCVFSGIFGPDNSVVMENIGSTLLCSAIAFFLLVDLRHRSADWPRFDIPEIGRLPPPRRPRSSTPVGGEVAHNWFGVAACCLSGLAVFRLFSGLTVCMGERRFFDVFFISELGTGQHADLFSQTLLSFGIFTIPFFLSFLVGHGEQMPVQAVKFTAGGCMAVFGIIGIGVWDLRHPLHYSSLATWLWALAIILDRYVPMPRGFVDLRFPTWVVKLTMAAYATTMLALPFGHGGRTLCVVAQRLVVLATVAWLLCLLKLVVAESLGIGERINGEAV